MSLLQCDVLMIFRSTTLCLPVLGIALSTFFVGCEKPLFPANLPRTPYERYQSLHGEYRSPTEQNSFGGQQPALRDRLRPLSQ